MSARQTQTFSLTCAARDLSPTKTSTYLALQERVIRITFSTVLGESGQEHCEVTGRMPSLNNTMRMALTDNSNSTQLMAAAQEDLQILSDFCSLLATGSAAQNCPKMNW